MSIRRTAVLFTLAALCVGALAAPTGAAPVRAPGSNQDPVPYRPPVDAPVVDAFRPPERAFGPGNRGLTYDLTPGTPVRASAPGWVVFSGSVGGTDHVTILHPDGLRATYSFLDDRRIVRGRTVRQGDIVGRASTGFHFGMRVGDDYIDPAAMFRDVEIRVRLVPHDEPPPPDEAGVGAERRAVGEVVDERSRAERFLHGVGEFAGDAIEVGRARLHVARQILKYKKPLTNAAREFASTLFEDCTKAAAAVPENPSTGHVAITVGGLGSSSGHDSVDDIDTDDLGYEDGDVIRYSYRGGRIPASSRQGPNGALSDIEANRYDDADTRGDLYRQGEQLADLVEQAAAARPDVPIDLLAHSQGGLVARLALLELERRGTLDAVGTVVTLGTPHDGVDLATVLASTVGARRGEYLATADRLGLDVSGEAVLQMSETSSLIRELRNAGVPDGVRFRTIAATGDMLVAATHSEIDGYRAGRVGLAGPAAHRNLPGATETQRELKLALGGRPPACRSHYQNVVDAVVPEAISYAENAIGAQAIATS